MSQIKLELHVDEVNAVLTSLGQQRFDQVAGLIGKIREQAIPQIPPPESTDQSGIVDAPAQ
jgi:hypothetical protein